MYQEILRNNDEKTYSYDREQLFLSKTAAVILSTTDRKMAENEKMGGYDIDEIRGENDIC